MQLAKDLSNTGDMDTLSIQNSGTLRLMPFVGQRLKPSRLSLFSIHISDLTSAACRAALPLSAAAAVPCGVPHCAALGAGHREAPAAPAHTGEDTDNCHHRSCAAAACHRATVTALRHCRRRGMAPILTPVDAKTIISSKVEIRMASAPHYCVTLVQATFR